MKEMQKNEAIWKGRKKLTLKKISKLELDAQKPFDGLTITTDGLPKLRTENRVLNNLSFLIFYFLKILEEERQIVCLFKLIYNTAISKKI